jgi:AraC-like DNA-binding protein
MASMLQTTAPMSSTPGPFGSGEGRVRFFRKLEHNGDHWSPNAVRNHYSDEGIRTILEAHFASAKPFLRHRYMLNDLVDETGIPRHVLSQFFQRMYGIGFPTLVNQSRIAFLLENLHRSDWKKYTQEAIGKECGFSSRNSFIKNVKRFLGKNPSQVMKEPESGRGELESPLRVVRS